MTSNTCNHSSNLTPVSHSQGAKPVSGRQYSWVALSTTENAATSRENWGMPADI